jgi:flagellar hook-associated protein 2
MGTIQTNVGINSGINISDVVTKLMALASQPKTLLQKRTDAIKSEQSAVTELSSLLLAVQYIGKNLAKSDLYNTKKTTSSDSNSLSATATSDAATGTYSFTPLRKAQSQQLISSAFSSDSEPIGAGSISFRFGSNVQRGVELSALNAGEGVSSGSIRVTDRAGNQAVIDLSSAHTIDDVLGAINGNTTINVTAAAQGGHIRLIDNTDQAVSNLKVQEVGRGQTAASLGLDGIDLGGAASNNTADGDNILSLYGGMNLNALHDGNGIRVSTVLPDINYTLRNGDTGQIDLSPIMSGSSTVDKDTTLNDLIQRFNADSNGELKLSISSDGTHLIAADQTTGTHAFSLSANGQSKALADLGLNVSAVGGVVTGRQIQGGLKSVMLSSLGGGNGLGALGSIVLTDRSGATDTVNLSSAVTVDDVIQSINEAETGIRAQVNDAKNGIELIDTTGATSGPMIVANDGVTQTATNLKIAVNGAVDSVNSGDLHLQVVSANTLLSDLNGGGGVGKGTLTIQDTDGNSARVDLRGADITTVGDAINAVNRLSLNVYAEINPTGDGIRLVDTAHGSSTLKVTAGSGTTAADLHLNRAASSADVEGVSSSVIDGTTTYAVEIGDSDTLTDVKQKINDLGAGATASIFTAGNNQYRLTLASGQSGKMGELVLDASKASASFQEITAGQDAILAIGSSGTGGASFLISSSSNKFSGVLPGLDVTMQQASGEPVTVSVSDSDSNVVASVKALVDNYNKFRTRLNDLTAYDSTSDKGSTLTGDATALRLETDLATLMSSQSGGDGNIQSLMQLGITLKDDGTLDFDQDTLKAAYADDPDAVQHFFTQADTGFADKLDALIEQLAGTDDTSLLSSRLSALSDTIQRNNDRMDAMQTMLDAEQTRLYNQYYQMDLAVGKMKSTLSLLDSIQYIAPVYSSSNSSSSSSS